MIRAAALLALASCLLASALTAGCAAPGDPTARHPVVPVAVTDLAARQYGNAIALTLTLPARSMDRELLPARPTIEIYRAALPPAAAPDKTTAWRLAYTIPSEQVDPYLKAGHIEFRDPLTADDFARAAGSAIAYKVRAGGAKARAAGDSNVVLARIYPPPEAPREVRLDVTESALVVNWTEAALPPGASSRVYRVYRGEIESGQENPPQDVSKAKLKTALEIAGTSASTDVRDLHFEFGTA